MTCERFSQKISKLFDCELSAKEKISVEEHLIACPACATTYAVFAKIDRAYRQVPIPETKECLISRIIDKTKPKVHYVIWWQAAAAIFVFVFGMTIGRLFFAQKIQNQSTYHTDHTTAKIEAISHRKKQSQPVFPYRVNLKDAPNEYYFVIENKADEKQWREFLREYAKNLQRRKNQKRLHRYRLETIPAHFVRYGDY